MSAGQEGLAVSPSDFRLYTFRLYDHHPELTSMRIAVPRETSAGERRVALVPESGKKLIQAGYTIAVEAGAGERAGFPDSAYREIGAGLEPDPGRLLESADVVLKVTPPVRRDGAGDEVGWMRERAVYV